MLAGIMANIRGVGKVKWRNRYGVFDSLEEARAAAQDVPVEEVYEITEAPGFVSYQPVASMQEEPPRRRRQTDDEAFLFILANV